jgi:Fic family protein
MECLDALEKFLHREQEDLPILVKAALVRVQFETIHPFLDGNGRLGRLLITFLQCVAGAIREPIRQAISVPRTLVFHVCWT